MSVKKFKVGDKARVREELVVGKRYGEQCFVGGMYPTIGRAVTIKELWPRGYRLEESGWNWTDEMLEPVEKTLENLEKGDLIKCTSGDTKKSWQYWMVCIYLVKHMTTKSLTVGTPFTR